MSLPELALPAPGAMGSSPGQEPAPQPHRAAKQMSIFCSCKTGSVLFGSPLKRAARSASVPSPVNMTELNRNLSVEPHKTPVTSQHSKMMSLAPLQNIRDLKVT